MLLIDTLSLIAAIIIYCISRTGTAAVIMSFFLFYIGYTTYIVHIKDYANFYDFLVLECVAFVAAGVYLASSRLRRGSDKAIVSIFLCMAIYLSGMVAEWYSGNYGFFDLYYSPFMIISYAAIFLFEIKAERINDRVVQWRANRVKSSQHNRHRREMIA